MSKSTAPGMATINQFQKYMLGSRVVLKSLNPKP